MTYNHSLNMQQQQPKTASKMLAIIKEGIENKTEGSHLRVYGTFVHPHLDYCEQFWFPHSTKDIEASEQLK